MRRASAPRRRLVILGLALAVAVAAVLTVPRALDRLGYCAEDFLPGDASLETDPYVQHLTQDAAVIRWWTADMSAGTVAWGQGSTLDRQVDVEPGESHAALLSGLEPGEEYQYHVRGDGIEETGRFRTAPTSASTVTLGVVGDTGTGGNAQYQVAALLAEIEPDAVLHTGDVVYRRGALCDYDDKFFDPYENVIESAPIYAAVGNHDLLAEDGAAFDAVFGVSTATGGRRTSFDYGPAHIVVLDSELYHTADDQAIAAQRTWLENDLRASMLPWTIVVLHRPPFSSTENQAHPAIRDDLVPLFVQHGVDLVLAGHAHNYERFAPMNGVSYVVTGGGGADLHDMTPGARTVASSVSHHALKLVLSPNALSLEAIDADGNLLDRLELSVDA